MDPQTLFELANWFKQHPNHLTASRGLTPSQMLFEFYSRPYDLCDYEHADSKSMGVPVVSPGGCQYIFRCGPKKNLTCDCYTFMSGTRCSFHSHLIFSEEFNMMLRDMFTILDGNYIRPQFYFDIPLIHLQGEFYQSSKNRLVYRLLPDSIRLCIGYIEEESGKIKTLTMEKLEEELGITTRKI